MKPDGTVIDAYHFDFTSGMSYSDFDCDGLKMLRISADSNAGKPKSSDPTRYYKEMVLVRLSEDHVNPLLTEGVIFDYAKEAAGWGELIAKGLNETNWRYPETYMKFPWKYGGISTSHTGVEVACLDQVFLNHDVCDIVKALYGGEMPASIPEDVLDLIFSDRENNNAYEILGIKDPEDSDEEDSEEDASDEDIDDDDDEEEEEEEEEKEEEEEEEALPLHRSRAARRRRNVFVDNQDSLASMK